MCLVVGTAAQPLAVAEGRLVRDAERAYGRYARFKAYVWYVARRSLLFSVGDAATRESVVGQRRGSSGGKRSQCAPR